MTEQTTEDTRDGKGQFEQKPAGDQTKAVAALNAALRARAAAHAFPR